MDDRVKMLQHNGYEIVYGDFTGLRGEAFRAVAEAHEARSLQCQGPVLRHLINFTETRLDGELRQHAAEMLERLTAKGFQVRTAAVGISGIQRIILNAVKKDMYAAKTLEEAKEWLTQSPE